MLENAHVLQTGILANTGNLGLLDIFLDANQMKEEIFVSQHEYITSKGEEWEIKYNLIQLSFDNTNDSAIKLSYMAIVHNGIENMLVDYLLKCNVDPASIYARYEKETRNKQTQILRDKAANKHFITNTL